MARSSVRLLIQNNGLVNLEKSLRSFGKQFGTKAAEHEIDKVLTKAVKPWQNAFNKGQMYQKLERRTGGLDKPMGNRKIKGTRSNVYGRKVAPKMKGKSAGWRAHFFARPARQINKGKRVHFSKMFAAQTKEVIRLTNAGIVELLDEISRKTNRT